MSAVSLREIPNRSSVSVARGPRQLYPPQILHSELGICMHNQEAERTRRIKKCVLLIRADDWWFVDTLESTI